MKIHSSLFFSKVSNEKITVHLMGWCILWEGKYGMYEYKDIVMRHQDRLFSCKLSWYFHDIQNLFTKNPDK